MMHSAKRHLPPSAASFRLTALALACALMSSIHSPTAHAATLVEDWVKTPNGSPDGSALGDVDGDGRMEIAVVLRGGTYTAGSGAYTAAQGTFMLLNFDGTLRFQVQTGKQLDGFPTFGDFDGDGFDEPAFCEVSNVGKCYVYDASGTLLFATGALYFPAMTNGGPVAADINNDGYDDLIVASSGGEIKAYYGPSGTLAWSYDLWTAKGDYPFGHPSVADIDNDGKLEVVLGGAQKGGVYVLNAENGTAQWASPPLLYSLNNYQNYFYASGPIVMNVDGDAALEIVASMAGYPGPSAVIALDTTGTVLWRTTATGNDFSYTSPAAADTDGDGSPEIYVQSFNGNLLKYRASDGVLQTTKAMGASSWASPAFLDVNYDGKMEIVTTTLSATFILNTALTTLDRYDNPNSGLYPPPIIGDTDADGTLDLITGAWYPQQLVSIPLHYTSAFSWSAFEGSARHTGAVPANSPATTLGNDPAQANVVLMNELVAAATTTGLTNKAKTALQNARNSTDTAYRDFLQGTPHLAVGLLHDAVDYLETAKTNGYPATSVAHLEQEITYLGILIFSQYIDRTSAIVGPTKTQVVAAKSSLTTANTQYNAANYTGAMTTAENATTTLRTFLDTPSQYTVANYCPTAVGEVYMAWECRINIVRDQVKALLTMYPGNSALTNADANLRTCVVWAPDLVFDQAYGYCKTADSNLASFATPSLVANMRSQLAFAIMRNTRLYIDDATVWFKSIDQAALTYAEGQYSSGVSSYNAVSYQNAHTSFANAYTGARPCTGSSFATPANGLTNGGCSP